MSLALSRNRLLATPLCREDPEAILMARVRHGEGGAFSELAARFGPRIYARFVRTFQDRHLAEDLTQDVLLRVYRARQRYEPRARFATWLFHITQNVARNALRAQRKHVRLCLGQLDGLDESGSRQERDLFARDCPSRPLERREVARAVRAAVGELGGRQRQALEMLQFQHRSYAEIAAALALTTKATKSLLYRARVQLRGHLIRFADSL